MSGRIAFSVAAVSISVSPFFTLELAAEPLLHVDVEDRQDRITELFDKYNLLTLPVIDAEGKLAGVITADEVISLLRER